MRRSTRRELVVAATAGAMTAAVPPAWGRLVSRRVGVGPGGFRDGVASGEPSHTAVTFWSRMRTDRPRCGARLIVARDEGLDRVVATVRVPTGRGINHTLKARVGGLDPATEYFYAWQSSTDVSPVGRTRTRPAPDSAVPLRIAFSSCQHYSFGYFSPHAHAAAEALDLYLFVGDYVYERGRTGGAAIRQDRIEAVDLASYRRKYRLYREDAGLRELHRRHPVAHVWDDHEVANDYTAELSLPQRIAGYRVAFEWLPRLVFGSDRHRIYKKIPFGRAADLFLLDQRQYRTGFGDGQPRYILGETQMQWLIAELKASRATWKLIANQVVVAADPYGTGGSRDQWDGFPADRARLLGEIERAGIRNVVFLTGDSHVFMCNLLASNFTALGDGSGRTPAAVEYVGGSVTSPGNDIPAAEVERNVPWNRQFNGHDHGYALLALDGAQLTVEYRRSDLTVPTGATAAFERFTQLAGINNVTRETLAPSL